MADTTLQLPEKMIDDLVKLPETGVGYQVVKVIMKNGQVLHNRKVINSEFLLLGEGENFTADAIDFIGLDAPL